MEADVLDPELMAHAVLAREQGLEIQKEVFNSLSGWKALVMLSALLSLEILFVLQSQHVINIPPRLVQLNMYWSIFPTDFFK